MNYLYKSLDHNREQVNKLSVKLEAAGPSGEFVAICHATRCHRRNKVPGTITAGIGEGGCNSKDL
jgi:hypothetical protein